MSSPFRILLPAALLLLGSSTLAQVTFAPDWNAVPLNVSNDAAVSLGQDVEFTDNALHVFWLANFALQSTRSLDGGQTFSPATVIPASGNTTLPAAAASGTTLHVTYNSGGLQHRRSLDEGVTWQAETELSASGVSSAVAADGNVVAVTWEDTPAGDTLRDVFASLSVDGGATFGPAANLSQSLEIDSRQPDVEVTGNLVVVTWIERGDPGEPGDLAVSRNSGTAGFEPTQVIAQLQSPFASNGPDVAIHGDGVDVAITWNDIIVGAPDVFGCVSDDAAVTFPAGVNLSNTDGSSFNPEAEFYGDRVGFWWNEIDLLGNSDIAQVVALDRSLASTDGPILINPTPVTFLTSPEVAVSCDSIAMTYALGNPTDIHVDTAELFGQLNIVGTGGCPGTVGQATWSVTGSFGGAFTLEVGPALPATPCLVIVGLGLAAPGTIVAGCPFDIDPSTILFTLAGITGGNGLVQLPLLGPLPPGFEVVMQIAYADAAGPQGVAMSRAGSVTTCP